MKKTNSILSLILVITFMIGCAQSASEDKSDEKDKKTVMVIHGGAGTMTKDKMSLKKEESYTNKLTEALQSGYDQLKSGSSSVDAVQAAINIMEDSDLFNAGKGAVFTNDGRNELDASIMKGEDLEAGAVAGVTVIKNPIDAAKAVMEESKHVMLSGNGAEVFAKDIGLNIVDTSYFYTERRWKSLQRAIKKDKESEDVSLNNGSKNGLENKKFGTVGAVALDDKGNLTAGTSTGGINNKKHGRIGDSPIIGAGTYANNNTAGISSTGQGEYFIREAAAHKVSDLIDLKELSLKDATEQVINEIGEMGGTGGMIGLNTKGEVSMYFNTKGMYRGTVDEHGDISIKIYEN